MGVILTERAAQEVQKFRDQNQMGENVFLRIGVTGGGCSGFNYSLGFDEHLMKPRIASTTIMAWLW